MEPSNDQPQNIENKQLKFSGNEQASNNDNDAPIKIIVTDPIEKDSGVHKFIVYTLKGNDKDGPFETFRRYSDFEILKKVLIKRWPGCYGNLESQFIEERRKMLETFCLQMAQLTHLYYSEEFRLFLRQTNIDLEKALNSLPEQTYEELIQKYQVNFKQLSGKEINTELVLKINSFQTYLKKIGVMLKNFKEMAKNAGTARSKFNEEFKTFSTYLMPEYEKNCVLEYVGGNEDKLLFVNPQDTSLNSILNVIKETLAVNSFEQLTLLLRTEGNDIAAFGETLAEKHNYESRKDKQEAKLKELQLDLQKILAGKSTFGGIFSKGSKEERISNLEKNIAAAKAELENIQFLCDIITVILGYIEIDRFKNEKQEKYYQIVKFMSKFEVEYAKGMQEYWSHVGSNFNLSHLDK